MTQKVQVDRNAAGEVTSVSIWEDRLGWDVQAESSGEYLIVKLKADQFTVDGEPMRYQAVDGWRCAERPTEANLADLMGKRRARKIVEGFDSPPEPVRPRLRIVR